MLAFIEKEVIAHDLINYCFIARKRTIDLENQLIAKRHQNLNGNKSLIDPLRE